MNEVVTVTITFGSAEEAEGVAAALVEARLAACAQVWPIGSTYRWQGKVEHAEEHRLEAKTLASGSRRSRPSSASGTAMRCPRSSPT
jgi:uncharacterized protein involved in tolerance to divalent cations